MVTSYAAVPTLVDTESLDSRCVLVVDDGRRFPLNVSQAVIDAHLKTRGFESLDSVCQARHAEVWPPLDMMKESEWNDIVRILKNAEEARALREHAHIRQGLSLSYSDIRELPYRLYGGLGQAGWRCKFYVSQQFEFRGYPHVSKPRPWLDRVLGRKGPWYYALLNAPGGNLFKTHVNVRREVVEIDTGVVLNHFIETLPDS